MVERDVADMLADWGEGDCSDRVKLGDEVVVAVVGEDLEK